MAFIHKIIGPNEELIGIARLHWIYGVKGLLWLGGLISFGGGINILLSDYIGLGLGVLGGGIFWLCTLIGVVMFSIYYIMMACTELGLTTERVIYKRGFIMVDVREIDLEEVKSESIDNGILGRILNYGYITLDARFIEDIVLPAINDPYRFIKAMNETRTNIKEDSMRVVIDQTGSRASKVAGGLRTLQDKTAKGNNEPPTQNLDDQRYEAINNDPVDNMRQVGEGLKPTPSDHMPDEQKPEIFKTDKTENKKATKNSSKPKKELFVHEEALHNKIIDDFEEVEGPDEEKKKG